MPGCWSNALIDITDVHRHQEQQPDSEEATETPEIQGTHIEEAGPSQPKGIVYPVENFEEDMVTEEDHEQRPWGKRRHFTKGRLSSIKKPLTLHSYCRGTMCRLARFLERNLAVNKIQYRCDRIEGSLNIIV